MDDLMKTEAKEIITSAVEKASGAGGVNVEVTLLSYNIFCIGCLQNRKRGYGPSVRSLLALRYGRGLLLRSDSSGQDHPVYVLCRQDRHSVIQVLKYLYSFQI